MLKPSPPNGGLLVCAVSRTVSENCSKAAENLARFLFFSDKNALTHNL